MDAPPLNVFLARQPVFTPARRVYGYELLFRSGLDNAFPPTDADRASAEVIARSLLLFGIRTMTRGRRAFINFTRDTLLQGYARLVPADLVVVEVLESVAPEPEVVAACRELKQAGYVLALDDFVPGDWSNPLLELADIVKIDVLATAPGDLAPIARTLTGRRQRPLAEKIETREVFDEAVRLGYAYLQGYFLSRPVILRTQDVPTVKLRYLEMLRELNRPQVDLDRVETLIKSDVSLSYKLLRLVNSVALGLAMPVSSVKHALLLLGEEPTRKWASVVVLAGIGGDTPGEVLLTSLVRARFCESLADPARLADRGQDLFLMGLFSLLDVLIGRPLAEILDGLPLAADVSAALLGGESRVADVFRACLAYEQGDWPAVTARAADLGVPEAELAARYPEAAQWAARSAGALGAS